MKVIIAGGGTGGHLFPGIAVAEELLERTARSERPLKKNDIIFVGTEHGIEARAVPGEAYPLKFVRARGIIGKSLLEKVKGALTFFTTLYDSYKIIESVRPGVVIGVGGYASAGMVLTAHLRGIPTMILEQNSVPGFANKFLGRFVDAAAVTYQESISFFPPEKTYLTGNPIRKRILTSNAEEAYSVFPLEKGRFTVFIFGGSLGAKSINRAALDALHYLLDLRQNIQFLHQTGDREYEGIRETYRRMGFAGIVAPFIYRMAEAYALADMVVCRAGATTLSEVTAIGKPAVLIPYPFAVYNHQEHNAVKLEDMGAAKTIRDRELNGETLAEVIRELYSNEGRRKEMQKAAAAFGRLDAAEKVVDIAMSLMKK